MKKLLVITMIILFCNIIEVKANDIDTNTAFTQNPAGGYTGSTNAVLTKASDIKKLRDNTYIMLKGNIVSKIGKEKYLFKDASGSVIIEIDDKNWAGITAGQNDTVIIEGEVDKDFNSTKVEVDTIRIDK